ncbi:hypothetical protein QYM36_020086, partial [Artemia franciscana]
ENMDDIVTNISKVKEDIIGLRHHDLTCMGQSLENFKETIASLSKLIAHDVTKISLMLGSPPYPDIETLKSLFSPMIPRLCLLQNTLEQTPKVGGRTLYKQYYQGVCSIVESVEEFCKQVIAFQSYPRSEGMKLLRTAQALENCDQIVNIPLKPAEIVRKKIQDETDLIRDAFEELCSVESARSDGELSDASDDGDEFEQPIPSLSSRHREILPYCLALVKVGLGMLKKLSQAIKRSGRSEKLEEVEELDKIGEMCSLVTSTVDDFVIAAEPPLSYEALKEAASELSKKYLEVLNIVPACHFSTEDDENWVQILRTAVDHNFKKIKENRCVA